MPCLSSDALGGWCFSLPALPAASAVHVEHPEAPPAPGTREAEAAAEGAVAALGGAGSVLACAALRTPMAARMGAAGTYAWFGVLAEHGTSSKEALRQGAHNNILLGFDAA